MKTLWGLLLFVLLAAPTRAQDRLLIAADEALTVKDCEQFVADAIPRIEAFTRMKFRRKIPVRIESKATWKKRLKQKGFGGMIGRRGLAFYRPYINDVTIIPWNMGYDHKTFEPNRMLTREEWLARLEPIIIHEITHALHHQNFPTQANVRGASLRKDGLSEYELDHSTVDFVLSEGMAELVPLRTSLNPSKMLRHPNAELSEGRRYMSRYQPDGKQPYRVKLSAMGYQDGLDILHHFSLMKGPRGLRGVLYRQPPRELLFQPEILATVELDDPPEPDSIFWFLFPAASMKGVEIRLAMNPGPDRFFKGAYGVMGRPQKGCLIGYATDIGFEDSAQGRFRYAFFIANPDDPGSWSKEQADSLKGNGEVTEKDLPLRLIEEKVNAHLISVKTGDGSVYMHAEVPGLVILAHETKPTPTLEKRVLLALRTLYIKRPTKNLYTAALQVARKKIKG